MRKQQPQPKTKIEDDMQQYVHDLMVRSDTRLQEVFDIIKNEYEDVKAKNLNEPASTEYKLTLMGMLISMVDKGPLHYKDLDEEEVKYVPNKPKVSLSS